MKKELIEKWVKQKGGTEKAAEYLGVNYCTIYRWKTGKNAMPKTARMTIERELR